MVSFDDDGFGCFLLNDDVLFMMRKEWNIVMKKKTINLHGKLLGSAV